MRRVVITGMGVLNSLGQGVPSVWNRLIAGDNGISKITLFNATQYKCKVAAEVREVDGFGLEQRDCYSFPSPVTSVSAREMRRATSIFLACAKEAFAASGMAQSGFDADSVGVSAGASVAFVDHELTAEYYRMRRSDGTDVDLPRFAEGGVQPPETFLRSLGDMIACLPAKALGLRGPALVVDTACAASGHAIGQAFQLVRRGRVSAMIAGGAAATVSPIGILYFTVLGALSQNEDPESASRPFDKCRDGFVMGEGGGAVVLEEYEHAKARGAKIYAEVKGFGSTTCAVNLTDPSPDGSAEEQAMRSALKDGSMQPEEIQYIALHGTSTQKNDSTECKAVHRLLGDGASRVLASSNKAQIGHTISGAAVSNLIMTVQAMQEGIAPPTMHLRNPDPELDLDFVPNQARKADISAALVNSFAFGGQNAVLAVSRV
jgi:3-oxoacyl-[acyl-carrier-protein] synthase II